MISARGDNLGRRVNWLVLVQGYEIASKEISTSLSFLPVESSAGPLIASKKDKLKTLHKQLKTVGEGNCSISIRGV